MSNIIKSITLLFIAVFFSLTSWAKENGIMNMSPGKEDSLWNYFPWIWVIGGAVFILLLIAMVRSHLKKV